jgi:hypothetical protein
MTQAIYEHVSEQIRREPAQSTRLLESWISADVGGQRLMATAAAPAQPKDAPPAQMMIATGNTYRR